VVASDGAQLGWLDLLGVKLGSRREKSRLQAEREFETHTFSGVLTAFGAIVRSKSR
jgi:hypothetical protein